MEGLSKVVPHRPGPTRAAYSKDGQYLFTSGSDCVVRRFKLGLNDEPLTLDPYHEDNVTGLVVSNEKIVTCSEDATVAIFDIKGGESDKLCRTTLPIRDVAFSPDGDWIAVASDETKVKIVNVQDMTRVLLLAAALAKSIKHVAFHPSGNMISAVDTNGAVRIYSLSTEEPTIVETISNIVPIVSEPDSDISCKVAWHPDGASFATPSVTRAIHVYDRIDWQKQVTFGSDEGHMGALTDLAWSPNGAYLASCALDNTIIVWETKTQKLVRKLTLTLYAQRLLWHPNQNTLSWTTNQGEVYTQTDIVSSDRPSPHSKPIHPSPGAKVRQASPARTNATASVVDDLDIEDAGAEWIDDDDGAGYIPNVRKRNGEHDIQPAKRYKTSSKVHEPIQPGRTPWRGQRRYLTLNMIGWIWSVEQDDHNTVTVEFHDRDSHRQYHFVDNSLYAFAALDDNGALFASPIRTVEGIAMPATVHFRPHDSWASYSNWTISLPPTEDVVAITISNSGIVVCTDAGYIRMYTLFGVPKRIYQSKCNPIVSAISHGNYAMVVSNGPVRHDGAAELVYSIYHTFREETVQDNDVLPLPSETTLRSLFFNDAGHPFIYNSNGLLSVLSKWKLPGQAQWIPVLDTNLLARRVGKDENYWPIGVVDQKFHCVILKGAERHPYFPRPITSELDFLVPITHPDHKDRSLASLENGLVQNIIMSTLAEEGDEAALETSLDKTLLMLLNLACQNEQDARALDLCDMFRKRSSLDAAVKLAGYHNRVNLAERISRLGED